ncbi:MAG: flagellar basal body P-ring formation chaperone FlgA, partial [Candidatus Margulisbacteria bacterium]|nr:flagellar basal body P-ring formation chaperone FlgA [Candidatus Margulisiibacteriota bacterium]
SYALDNPEQKVTDTIKNYIVAKYPDWSKDEIRLTYKTAENIFSEMTALPKDSQLSVIEVYTDFKPVGSVVFPIRAVAGGMDRKFMIRAKVDVVKKVAAAARLIKKGRSIESADLKIEERDVALLPQKYFLSAEPLVSKEAKISIPGNSTIFEWMVGEVPLVRRGAPVTLIVTAPGLAVKTKAQAQEDGVLGSEIKVKRADSNKIVAGKIISAGEVEVKL